VADGARASRGVLDRAEKKNPAWAGLRIRG
jgi:hypothetical protein